MSTMQSMAIGKQKRMCSLLICPIYELGMCDIVEHSIGSVEATRNRVATGQNCREP